MILGGCVVEPPAVSGERERFILELDRDARAQVTLFTKPGETLPALHYGQKGHAENRIASTTTELRDGEWKPKIRLAARFWFTRMAMRKRRSAGSEFRSEVMR